MTSVLQQHATVEPLLEAATDWPSSFLCRSELSVEKSSVLQSELESCNQLQELEPLNKCEWIKQLCSSRVQVRFLNVLPPIPSSQGAC